MVEDAQPAAHLGGLLVREGGIERSYDLAREGGAHRRGTARNVVQVDHQHPHV